MEYRFICGDFFQSLADTVVTSSFIEQFHTSAPPAKQKVYIDDTRQDTWKKLAEAHIIFVYTHILDEFKSILTKIPLEFPEVVLITHNSDHIVDSRHQDLLDNPQISRWYAQNVQISHPKLHCIPIGLANRMWSHGNQSLWTAQIQTPRVKTQHIMANFSLWTQSRRSFIAEQLERHDIAVRTTPLSQVDYIKELAVSKYVIAPPGNGPDCHRIWEALYMGAIPVVEESARVFLAPFLDDVPIYFVDTLWDDGVSELKLRSKENREVVVYPRLCLSPAWWTEIITSTPQQSAIIFIHIGPKSVPPYAKEAIEQARVWNPHSCIYMLTDDSHFEHKDVKRIDLCTSDYRVRAMRNYYLKRQNIPDFWRCTTERFLQLSIFMDAHNIQRAIHIENDNLIFFEVDEMMKCVTTELAAPMDNDKRCVPGVVFVRSRESLSKLVDYILCNPLDFSGLVPRIKNDMDHLGEFWNRYPDILSSLPVVPGDYQGLWRSIRNQTAVKPEVYSRSDGFGGIFDAAAIGQYLFGIDPNYNNGNFHIGYINPDAVYRVDSWKYQFMNSSKLPHQKILVVSVSGSDSRTSILSLHIHCKELASVRQCFSDS